MWIFQTRAYKGIKNIFTMVPNSSLALTVVLKSTEDITPSSIWAYCDGFLVANLFVIPTTHITNSWIVAGTRRNERAVHESTQYRQLRRDSEECGTGLCDYCWYWGLVSQVLPQVINWNKTYNILSCVWNLPGKSRDKKFKILLWQNEIYCRHETVSIICYSNPPI